MTRAHPTSRLIAALPMLLALASPAVATEECVPTEENEFIEAGGGNYLYRLPEGTAEECAETSPGPGEQGGSQHLVAHFTPTAGTRHLLAIDASSLPGRIGATQWLAQAVATAPDAPPQVIEIGLQLGAAGILLATRDVAGTVTVAGTPLRVIGGDRALLSISVDGDAALATLALGGPGGEAMRWPIARGASVALLGAAGHGSEPAVIALGSLE